MALLRTFVCLLMLTSLAVAPSTIAGGHLARAEPVLASGNYGRAYLLARRVDVLRLNSKEVQQ